MKWLGLWEQEGLLDGSVGEASTCQCRRPMRQLVLIPGYGGGHGDPLSVLAWRPHEQRNLAGYNPYSRKEVGHSGATEHTGMVTEGKMHISRTGKGEEHPEA